MKYLSLCLLFASAVLTGCGSMQELKKEAAWEPVLERSVIGREEPFHNVTVAGDVRRTTEMSASYVPLPERLPAEWAAEFIDHARRYVYEWTERTDSGDEKTLGQPKFLERVVFRALVCRPNQPIELFHSFVDEDAAGLFVLLPAQAKQYDAAHLLILSSDGTWGMTSAGTIVPLKGVRFDTCPTALFEAHPSQLPAPVVVKRGEPEGDRFFAGLEKFFPWHGEINGVHHSGRRETKFILGTFTKVETPADRVVSCGSFKVTTAAFFAPAVAAVGAVISGLRNAYISQKPDCFR